MPEDVLLEDDIAWHKRILPGGLYLVHIRTKRAIALPGRRDLCVDRRVGRREACPKMY